MPALPPISDPGHRLVSLCMRHGVKVVPLPGASAFVAALAASGMPSRNLRSWDFFPRAKRNAASALRALLESRARWRFTKRRIGLSDTLEDALEILGNRPAVIAREITKMYEEILRGHLEDLLAAVRERKPPRGEITLLIGPSDGDSASAPPSRTPTRNSAARLARGRKS